MTKTGGKDGRAVDGSIEHLTFRECEVLEALLRGLTNKQIEVSSRSATGPSRSIAHA